MNAFIAYVVAISLVVPIGTPISALEAGAQASRPATPSRPVASAPVDGGWPRAYIASSGARIVLYEPQVVSWPEQKRLTMYAAVSYTPKDGQKSVLGTLRIEADTKVAVAERLVNFSEFAVTESNFPTLSRDQLATVVSDITSTVPREERVIGLDRVLAAVDAGQITPKNVDGVRADPPAIFFSETPAVLVNVDGEPVWSPIKDTDLRFAANTNWDLFEQGTSKTYYLRIDSAWVKASKIEGPWAPVSKLPDSFYKLPNDDNWKDVKAALASPKAGMPIQVFVSQTPAELILLRGAPAYVAVTGTQLQWVSNTDSDVFRIGKAGAVYYLVSGRWFSAPGFSGPWTFATPNLPVEFKRIPLDHPRSRVLASVPGTTQALEAVLLAQVPQTARISRTEVKAPDGVYQGQPQFEAIEKTTLTRAVNTDKDILKVGDLYYMCFEGVWFVSRSASGPWTVTDAVPKEIYEIPISSPAYNVTNVTVESADSDAVVFATAAAYTGMMVAWGTAVWGSGYYYPPYIWGGGYYPRYPSYGYGARYNPWTGAYTRAGAVYGPYGGAGYGARYNPGTGTYARGAAAWGPGGARGAAEAWNPRTGTSAQTRQGAGVYGSWGATGVQRGDQWAQTARVTNRATGTTTRATQGSGGGSAVSRNGSLGRTTVGTTGGGNMYAGHDGNVYRNQGGSWQKYDGGSWSSLNRPTGTTGQLGADSRQRAGQAGFTSTTQDQLNRDRAVRAEGAQRTRDLGTVRSSGGSTRSFAGAGSYRPSGGGMRAGGGGGMRAGGGGRRR